MSKQKTELKAALEQAKNGEWEIANDILHGFGIEFVSCGDKELKYINLGDTYDTTICAEMCQSDYYDIYQENDPPFISSWGSWFETTEQEICEQDGVIRCGYCGSFTPMDKEDWRDVICENCGELVGG